MSSSVLPIIDKACDFHMSQVEGDESDRWYYRELFGPCLAEDNAGKWWLTCCTPIPTELRLLHFRDNDWSFPDFRWRWFYIDDHTSIDLQQLHTNTLKEEGLTLIGKRGPLDAMLDGTWQIGQPDFETYLAERLAAQ